ncbi:hypothetical protein SAMD00019534_039630 [Acytostelium subglobosum LB1]|uniref:hypothetical protein n=1 Tax=Acytostelium subglobosum LB1 TaxID=1410327 RepID=UPI000644B754|nr:hypothetical protein SAMD00019534_039630 [Acytostelium subglobosum LB1]GAM20788.1 hypothetical protein SAMD00019534_039630 [Acytostelium subglobosum LB1]|eukprot:XP_012755922.1 hypothetical protein SAMD00019534_039630 [Acytostelium subglobosum LB1]
MIARRSTVSFNGTLHTISPKGISFVDFCQIDSATNSNIVASFNSSLYFENTIFNMKGSVVVRDFAKVIFSGLILPVRRLTIKLYDHSTIHYRFKSPWDSMPSKLAADLNDGIPSDTPAANEPISFELNGNSNFQVEGHTLKDVSIVNTANGSITMKSVELVNSTISSTTPIKTSNNVHLNGASIVGHINNDGSLSGVGQISGTVSNNGNIGSVSQVTKLTINGKVMSSPDSTINMVINPDEASHITITDSWDAQGTIQVRVNGNVTGDAEGKEFTLFSVGQNSPGLGSAKVSVVFDSDKPSNRYTIHQSSDGLQLSMRVYQNDQVMMSPMYLGIAIAGASVLVLSIAGVSIYLIKRRRNRAVSSDIVLVVPPSAVAINVVEEVSSVNTP